MPYTSADEQSEDGELRQSPEPHRQPKETEFSVSEEDGENIDSLDIKPPQARLSSQAARRRRGENHERHHKRERHNKEERHSSHREKHHREKRNNKDREHYLREKERYYREQQVYEQYRERSNSAKEASRHKYEETKKLRIEKHRRYEEEKRELADKKLQDLRERLISKRGNKSSEDEVKDSKEKKTKDVSADSDLQECDEFTKELVCSSGDERRLKITDEERTEQELRREKLLQAEREMDRLKEQSRVERERRHLEKTTKRRIEETEFYSKRTRIEETITVTDNSEEDEEEEEEEEDGIEEEEEEEVEEEEERFEDEYEDDSVHSRSTLSERSSESREHGSVRRARSSSESERSRSVSPINHKQEKTPETEEDTSEMAHEEVKVTATIDGKSEDDLPPYYPAVQGCRSVEEFQCLNRIEEGTYGVVYRAKDKRTDDIVALKRLKMEKEKEGFPITALREINTLLKGQHPNIVTVREIVVGSNMDKIFIVMDYVEHDLKSLMETMRHKKQNFMPGEVKCLLRQLLAAVAHLHDNWILHRDLKTSNLLLSHKGILKVGDFGLAREYGSPLKAYTSVVVTLWYRAPELLLCAREYSTPIDMWSVGCIFAELLLMNALFPGKSEVDQLNRIFKDLGTPSEKIWPGFNKLPAVQKMKFTDYPVSNLRTKFHSLTELGLNLLIKFLTFDPVQRVTAEEALQHAYFNEAPLPIDPAMFPTWPAKSELGHKRALAASPKPPSGGGEYKKLGGDGDDDGYGFRIGMGSDARRLGGGFSLKF